MIKPLRYILVGTGGMGNHWCEHTLPRLAEMGKAVPVAAMDVNPLALQNPQRCLGLSADRCYTNLERALDIQADFLISVTPSPGREALVDAALARGLHILSEKPLAHTMAACCRIYQKVTAAGRKMAVTMSHRLDQDKTTLERAVASGEYGLPHYLVARYTSNCSRRGTIGEAYYDRDDVMLIEAAVHHLDILRALSGSNAKAVYASTWTPPWSQFKGHATSLVNVEMQNGVRGQYEGSMSNAASLNNWGNEYVRAECEHATLELDHRRVRVLKGHGHEQPVETHLPLIEQPAWANPWLAEMFCDWLLDLRDDHPTSLEDNLQCAALTFAAVESARTGKLIDVQSFLQQQLQATQFRAL